MNSLESSIRNVLLQAPDVVQLTDLRRSTLLFSQDQPSDSLYFIEEGLVKLTRTNRTGGRIILAVRGPHDLVGEEVLSAQYGNFQSEAEVLTNVTAFRIPRDVLHQALSTNSEWIAPLIGCLLAHKEELAKKVELLCLHDVEFRILHYMAELCTLVKPLNDSNEFQIPITQLELADLIGATRETTSTTLNQLERRGLIKLSRRMLTVPSPELLRQESSAKTKNSSSSRSIPIVAPELSAQSWQN